MKRFIWDKLDQVICEAVRQYGGDFDTLEFWLDTSSAKLAKQSPSMYLVFYGFTNHADFDNVIEQAQQNDDMSLLEDNVKKSSEQTWLELAQVDDELSTGAGFISNRGEEIVAGEIASVVAKNSELFATFSRIFLHWVDGSDIKWIKK